MSKTKEKKYVQLNICSADGGTLTFKVKTTTKLDKMFNAFYKNKGFSEGTVRFSFDGKRLVGDESVEGSGLQNNDIIDAMVEQTGGGRGGGRVCRCGSRICRCGKTENKVFSLLLGFFLMDLVSFCCCRFPMIITFLLMFISILAGFVYFADYGLFWLSALTSLKLATDYLLCRLWYSFGGVC